jgi:hypothetical protein
MIDPYQLATESRWELRKVKAAPSAARIDWPGREWQRSAGRKTKSKKGKP